MLTTASRTNDSCDLPRLGFLFGISREKIGAGELEELELHPRDAMHPPLRNGTDSDLAQPCGCGRSADSVDDLVGLSIHKANLSALRSKAASTLSSGMFSMLSMSNTLFDRLQEVCRDQGIPKPIGRDIQAIAGISSGRVTQIKQEGVAAKLGSDALQKLSRLGYSTDWIQDGKGPKRPGESLPPGSVRLRSISEVPIVGTTQGGPPDRIWEETGYPVGHGGLYVDVATADPHAYGLRVVGDSMSPRIMEGEWVVVEPGTVAQPGDDVVVKTTDGEVMVKQLVAQHGDTVILASINEAFKRISRPLSEIVFIHYVGSRLPARAIKRRIETEHYVGEDRRHEYKPVAQEMRGTVIEYEGGHEADLVDFDSLRDTTAEPGERSAK